MVDWRWRCPRQYCCNNYRRTDRDDGRTWVFQILLRKLGTTIISNGILSPTYGDRSAIWGVEQQSARYSRDCPTLA
ncbi:SAC3 family protein 1 [Fusarium oxysporum f. sp. albedinis]|nr:SAC3 family protein 1 [Fusarium oxysporum f. sp. albedinis]